MAVERAHVSIRDADLKCKHVAFFTKQLWDQVFAEYLWKIGCWPRWRHNGRGVHPGCIFLLKIQNIHVTWLQPGWYIYSVPGVPLWRGDGSPSWRLVNVVAELLNRCNSPSMPSVSEISILCIAYRQDCVILFGLEQISIYCVHDMFSSHMFQLGKKHITAKLINSKIIDL